MALPEQASARPVHAAAKPTRGTKIGPVSGLAAHATKPNDSYTLKATWDVLTGASAYAVSVSNAGTVVASSKLPQPTAGTVRTVSWVTQLKLPAMTDLTIKVVPLAGRQRGLPASTSLVLPDLTAPVGTYALALDGTTATVTEESLSDDVTSAELITRSIDWGTGKGFEPWPSGKTTSFTYPSVGLWKPQVRIADQATPTNERTIALQTVVIGDETAPSGSYTTTPQNAWATYTKVVLTQTALADDFSAAVDVVRWVDWKDGTPPTQWTTGTTVSHVYQAAGSHTPSVRLVDEARNEAVVESSAVTVAVDATAPKVTVRVPRRKAAYVSSWKTVRGTARDGAGTGIRSVRVRVVERRGATWYAYRAPSKRWVRGGPTKASAWRRARAAVVPTTQGRWSVQVARLRRGTIVVAARASDRVGNASRTATVKKRLTR